MVDSPARYSRPAIIAHWASALLIALAFVFGLTVDLWPRDQRAPWVNLHALIGIAIVALLAFRLIWRFVQPGPGPVNDKPLEILATKIGHGALYALSLAGAITGVRALFLRGRGVDFGLFQIASPFERTGDLIKPATELHETFAYALVAVALAHAAMALYHHFVRRDGLLDRMR